MPRLVVVLPLQPLEDGAGFALRDWPLHLTAVPTFSITSGIPVVAAVIGPLLVDRPAILARAGPEEGFGRARGRPASVVALSDELAQLHAALLAALSRAGAAFDHPDFTGAGYRPHVTWTRAARLRDGDRLELRQAAIVDMEPQGEKRLRRVVSIFGLHSPRSEPGVADVPEH